MIEVEEKEKIVIAKPIACRPRFSNLKTFSELLSVATDASPSVAFTETDVAVIRPTTARFKPDSRVSLIGVAEASEKAPESNIGCNVVYRPIAKLVSRTTVSLLSNLGGSSIAPTQKVGEVGNAIHSSYQVTQNFPTQTEQRVNPTVENHADETKSPIPANSRDRPSYDGHNWRKYGQKQVKGSEYPRSYYKCTYPNCPVKKKPPNHTPSENQQAEVAKAHEGRSEKTLDGRIAEIVYKGEHNHLKPQPPNHTPSENQQAEVAKAHEGRSENQDLTESSNQPTFSGTTPVNYPVTSAACNAGPSVSNNSLGECEEVGEVEAERGSLRTKRTRSDNQSLRGAVVGEASSDPQTVVQNNTDSGLIGDGFRWRKYGQKVVKGKKYPRSYYRCTNPDCNVRKYVERTFEDPSTFITTYEGKHNHAMPIKTANAVASKTSTKN